MNTPSPVPSRQAPSPATITLSDLTSHLLWPMLLRAPRMGFSPHRILLCAAAITIVGLVDALWRLGSGGALGPVGTFLARESDALGTLVRAAARLDAQATGRALASMVLDVPLSLATSPSGWSFAGTVALVVALPVAFAIFAMFATAVCRSVALEACIGERRRWTGLLHFALARWKTILGAALGPPVLGAVLALLIAGLGWLLLGLDGFRIVGAVLLPFFVLAGAIVALMLGGYVLGGAMILPGVVCDDADAFDAVQRAYALLFARPLAALLYGLTALAASILGFAFVAAIAALILAVVSRLTATPLDLAGAESATTPSAADGVLSFYVSIIRLILAAYGLSTLCAASTLFFLVMRRRVDGQDAAEIVLTAEERA